jgi:arylsulfatase A
MDRRLFLKSLGGGALFLIGGCRSSSKGTANQAKTPNIVIICADDMGYGDLGCYGGLGKTPNLDAFAKEGVRLTSCYAGAPNCSPSRASLLTGRFPTRCGIYSYIPASTKIPTHPMHLPKREVTLARLLKQADYETCHVGKWHLSKLNSGQPQPKDHGFDYSFGTDNNAEPSHQNPVNFIRNGVPVGMMEGYSCQIVADEAISWLQKRTQTHPDKPFFLYVAFHEPHVPLASPPEMMDQYPEAIEKDRQYYANIQNMDNAAGRLLRILDTLALHENTLVFFTSDNGPWRDGSQAGLRGKKGRVYEGGIRVPGLLRWPGVIQGGGVSNEPVHGADILPTVSAMAGLSLPKDRVIDGEDIMPLLKGNSWKRSKPMYWYFYRAKPQLALRDDDWVLVGYQKYSKMPTSHPMIKEDMDFIKNAQWDRFELYHLPTDLKQQNDLANKEREKLETLKKTLFGIHSDIVAEVPHWPWV